MSTNRGSRSVSSAAIQQLHEQTTIRVDDNTAKSETFDVSQCDPIGGPRGHFVWPAISSDGIQGRGKRDIAEKTRRPAESSGAIPTCRNLGSDPARTRTWFGLSHRYTQHDENTARQFRILRLEAMGDLMRVAVSPLTLPRLSASNAEKALAVYHANSSSTSQRHVGAAFANQRLVVYRQPAAPPLAARSSLSDTRPAQPIGDWLCLRPPITDAPSLHTPKGESPQRRASLARSICWFFVRALLCSPLSAANTSSFRAEEISTHNTVTLLPISNAGFRNHLAAAPWGQSVSAKIKDKLETAVYNRPQPPGTLPDLIRAAQMEWDLRPDNTLITIMPRRVRNLCSARGAARHGTAPLPLLMRSRRTYRRRKNILGIRTLSATRNLVKLLDDCLRPYKFCSGPAASNLGGSHLAECGSEVKLGREMTTAADEEFVGGGDGSNRNVRNALPFFPPLHTPKTPRAVKPTPPHHPNHTRHRYLLVHITCASANTQHLQGLCAAHRLINNGDHRQRRSIISSPPFTTQTVTQSWTAMRLTYSIAYELVGWLREALGMDPVSDWLLLAAKRSPLAGLAACWRASYQASIGDRIPPPRRTRFDSRRVRSLNFRVVGIVPDDAAGRRVFSGISRHTPCIQRLAPYSSCFTLVGSQDLDITSRPLSLPPFGVGKWTGAKGPRMGRGEEANWPSHPPQDVLERGRGRVQGSGAKGYHGEAGELSAGPNEELKLRHIDEKCNITRATLSLVLTWSGAVSR
ncbi:hypothetical protein PR048_027208 [Dryococelus australis]|uniref:Uncharacterized protein n=1 Tax=Dryococelus australis TaxID=614101 RepID=A0ABQ9GET7_9NEOP|nr:hypothetical protein PR048_027208 [Dryococelus australis]